MRIGDMEERYHRSYDKELNMYIPYSDIYICNAEPKRALKRVDLLRLDEDEAETKPLYASLFSLLLCTVLSFRGD